MSTASDRPSPPAGGQPILSPLRAVAAVCIVAPFVAMLWIPSYNKMNPKLLGFPFFYWYQLLWVVITALLMVIAVEVVKRDNAVRRGQRAATSKGTSASGSAPASGSASDDGGDGAGGVL